MTTKLTPPGTSRRPGSSNGTETQSDRRAERRAARRAQNRVEILDAAEAVFGEYGIRDGSLRQIAMRSGFSTAAIYMFFENKQHLLSETLTRRAEEWDRVVQMEAEQATAPLDKLHRIVDRASTFFAEHPNFRLLLRHIRGGPTITGPVLAEFADEVDARYLEILMRIARIVRDGQQIGEVRAGDERSIAHLYSVLVNEYVLLGSAPGDSTVGSLTPTEFHEFIDDALRPSSRPSPGH